MAAASSSTTLACESNAPDAVSPRKFLSRKSPERWLASLAPFPNFLVLSQGQIVAHAVLCPEGDAGEVAVFVGQENRGRGLGRCLLSELVEEARRQGLRRVWGLTEFDNIPMRRPLLHMCLGKQRAP